MKKTKKVKKVKSGQKYKVKGITYKIISTKKKTVKLYRGAKKSKAVVPAKVKIMGKKYKVVSIARKAFKGDKKLKKLIIKSPQIRIGKQSFMNCTSIRTINITKCKKITLEGTPFKNSYTKKVKLKVNKQGNKNKKAARAFMKRAFGIKKINTK